MTRSIIPLFASNFNTYIAKNFKFTFIFPDEGEHRFYMINMASPYEKKR